MSKVELIFVPLPALGHLVSTVELAKRLIDQDDRIHATILNMKWSTGVFVDPTKQLTVSRPDRIHLVDLPQPHDLPSLDQLMKSPEAYVHACIQSYIPHVRTVVSDILSQKASSDSESTRVAGLVLDFFSSPIIDVATELGLPSYVYFPSNTSFFALLLYLLSRHRQDSLEFEVTDPEHVIPGFVNPVPRCVLPSATFNKDGGYTTFIKVAEKLKDAKGIMVNTFQELEAHTLEYFNSNAQTPPIYPVGPVINLDGLPHPELDQAQRDKAMKWLDDQPDSSVIFLCFGSFGNAFGPPQLKEIALGLEQSGCRFLWAFRPPPLPQNGGQPEEMFPEGFLERTQGRGMVCGWTPQVEVLGHKAIGGFVSHCGWNSIMESLWFGVPIVTWPIYAEQQLNAFKLVKELGLAVELRLDYIPRTDDVVKADEIEKAVRLALESGSEVRKKVKDMSEMARKAIVDGGSSFISIGKLINDMIGATPCM